MTKYKNEEIQKRREDILKMLCQADKEHPVSLKELINTFNVARETIYGDLRAIQKNNNIEKVLKKDQKTVRKEDRKSGFYIDGQTANGTLEDSGIESVLDVLLMITIQLSEKPMTMNEIIKSYDRICSYDSDDRAVMKNAVNRKVNQLVEKGHLVEKENKYSISPSAPVYLSLTKNQILRLNDLILIYGQGKSYADTLAGIAKQLQSVYEGGILREDRDASGIGLHRIRSAEVKHQVERIHKYAYDRKKLSITYEGREGIKNEIKGFSTGLVIYASDKDCLYLIGKCDKHTTIGETQTKVDSPRLSNPYFVLDVKGISEIREENEVNTDFQSEEYMKMYQQMLVVDVAPPEKVSVEVSAGNRNLIRKMELHVEKRNLDCPEGKGSATFTKDGDHYLYSDTVRGVLEMARFLRQFGSGVTAREPESLRETMKKTAERALKRYGVK